ncbi:hypothetical protein HPB49_008661 [Dermacentor silvarum]|uniref:Uncharacterized protein n=1 Tax=Dermacentor silvarum TaxID=543639 RepID=A0ACB8CK19_DERSI|nr:hypothetical protein HPB49_008661 [Dermacentor silvarum]
MRLSQCFSLAPAPPDSIECSYWYQLGEPANVPLPSRGDLDSKVRRRDLVTGCREEEEKKRLHEGELSKNPAPGPGRSDVMAGPCQRPTGAKASFVTTVSAVKLVNVDIPSPTTLGETVGLSCIYELNGDRLYSVKWYKNDVEFYRFVPNDWPPGQFLPLPGVDVDLARSGRTSVYLRNVNLHSAGTYRCEVSAEAPSFDTVGGQKDMAVLGKPLQFVAASTILPTEGPRITGGQAQYRIGDTVSVNCTSAKSKPAATLRWYVNDVAVAGADGTTEYSTTLHADGLETASLGLRFVLTEDHFRGGNMKLKCTATISRVYTMSNEELVFGSSSSSGGRHQKSGLHISENTSRGTNTFLRQGILAPLYRHCVDFAYFVTRTPAVSSQSPRDAAAAASWGD